MSPSERPLAYVFWHRPRRDASIEAYRAALIDFHANLAGTSACFWREKLPFEEVDGYEDWYLIDGWADLGGLNERAVDSRHRGRHDVAARLLGAAWGGVYALVRGEAVIPEEPRWMMKPPGEPTPDFLASIPEPVVWQRQLVLGPAPEFCVTGHSPARNPERIA